MVVERPAAAGGAQTCAFRLARSLARPSPLTRPARPADAARACASPAAAPPRSARPPLPSAPRARRTPGGLLERAPPTPSARHSPAHPVGPPRALQGPRAREPGWRRRFFFSSPLSPTSVSRGSDARNRHPQRPSPAFPGTSASWPAGRVRQPGSGRRVSASPGPRAPATSLPLAGGRAASPHPPSPRRFSPALSCHWAARGGLRSSLQQRFLTSKQPGNLESLTRGWMRNRRDRDGVKG
ncbi:translation initiation factor IF-2-like [Nycticebus coucang]|uniref:translation initiation factor IF-2-like n=1 Tax=Nycticebus coucang TaxID=9470 RepID=UPI00234CAEBD|nr:translation initiation factor IF-2-like [Nycticebus coucang]